MSDVLWVCGLFGLDGLGDGAGYRRWLTSRSSRAPPVSLTRAVLIPLFPNSTSAGTLWTLQACGAPRRRLMPIPVTPRWFRQAVVSLLSIGVTVPYGLYYLV